MVGVHISAKLLNKQKFNAVSLTKLLSFITKLSISFKKIGKILQVSQSVHNDFNYGDIVYFPP